MIHKTFWGGDIDLKEVLAITEIRWLIHNKLGFEIVFQFRDEPLKYTEDWFVNKTRNPKDGGFYFELTKGKTISKDELIYRFKETKWYARLSNQRQGIVNIWRKQNEMSNMSK